MQVSSVWVCRTYVESCQDIFHVAAPRSFLHFAYLRQAEEGAAATGQIQPPVL